MTRRRLRCIAASRDNVDFCGGLGTILGYREQTPTSTLNRMSGCLGHKTATSGGRLRCHPQILQPV
ncbi:MAG: hypothetical protein ABWZ64_15355, partial [Xanthobacteraceae bacterium]